MTLERAIADLARSGSNTAVANNQLSLLAGLQASIGTASTATLAAMSGEVAAAVAESRTVADQSRQEAATTAAGSAVALADAARASRAAVNDAMDSLRHIPLTFASQEDERAYREREEQRKAYMAAQQAKHTPEGELNASGAGVGQMVDAKAHGAQGPEFNKQWEALATTTEKLREQVRLSGGSTKEFDDHLRADLRQTMRSKGLTDIQIDAQFAARPDPLEAAKAFVASDDMPAITARVSATRSAEDAHEAKSAASSAPSSTMNDAMAALKSAGVVASTEEVCTGPAHGVTAQIASAPSAARQA